VARLSPTLLVLLLVAVSLRAFTNSEYGVEPTIPAGFPECVARTGMGHIHGVGTVLVGRDCENPQNQPAFNVLGNYNTAEYPNALEALRGDECTGSRYENTSRSEPEGPPSLRSFDQDFEA